MPLYPPSIRRCQHLKTNGIQCGSPALRDETHCYYHRRWSQKGIEEFVEGPVTIMPTLEDANSIQAALADVVRLLRLQALDHRTAALMLYAMQTASANLKHTTLNPEPTQVVIDPDSVDRRPLGATAWSKQQGREYDEFGVEQDDDTIMRNDALRLVWQKFGPKWRNELKLREGEEESTRQS